MKSLLSCEYYANPQNKFWQIIEDVLGISHGLSYEERIARVQDAGISLWDVCHRAHRSGSLDSKLTCAEPNDFDGFLRSHPYVNLICFNGTKAQNLFNEKVVPVFSRSFIEARYELLPSTSPANAAKPYKEKLSQWRIALTPVLGLNSLSKPS